MKNKTKYTDEPLGRLSVIEDFLPPPEELVLRRDQVKVTMSLSKSSVDFFKKEAGKRRTSYQAMIRSSLICTPPNMKSASRDALHEPSLPHALLK